MVVKATANYKFGGYPIPTYEGMVAVEFHADDWHGELDSVASDDTRDKAKKLLREKVQRESAYNGNVTLSDLALDW